MAYKISYMIKGVNSQNSFKTLLTDQKQLLFQLEILIQICFYFQISDHFMMFLKAVQYRCAQKTSNYCVCPRENDQSSISYLIHMICQCQTKPYILLLSYTCFFKDELTNLKCHWYILNIMLNKNRIFTQNSASIKI